MTLNIIYNRVIQPDHLVNICSVISALYTPLGTQTEFMRLRLWDTLGPDLQYAGHPRTSLWSIGMQNSLQDSPFSLLVCVSLPQFPFGNGAIITLEGQVMKKE